MILFCYTLKIFSYFNKKPKLISPVLARLWRQFKYSQPSIISLWNISEYFNHVFHLGLQNCSSRINYIYNDS